MREPRRLRGWAGGPPPALPPALDRVAERWAGLPARVRLVVGVVAVSAVVAGAELRVAAVEARWGGAPQPVLVAPTPLPVGAALDGLRRTRLPPAAVPAGALRSVPPGARLVLPLGPGGVLTRWHLEGDGPAAGLSPALRALPLPVDEGWGIVAGGWVDVWVLSAGEEPAVLVARSRPVLEVRDAEGQATALVGLSAAEVSRATAGLAIGRVLLAHGPAPAAVSIPPP